jgi:hypothetical protein
VRGRPRQVVLPQRMRSSTGACARWRTSSCCAEPRHPGHLPLGRHFQASPTTAQRWAARTTAPAGPRHAPSGASSTFACCATGTPTDRGPAAAGALTVHRVLTPYGLAHLDRAADRVIRRYERSRPGEPVQVDIKNEGSDCEDSLADTFGHLLGARIRELPVDLVPAMDVASGPAQRSQLAAFEPEADGAGADRARP